MRKITQKLTIIFLLLMASLGYSQKVAVIGINHVGTDGFSFVVTNDLTNGEVIYFTENEYNPTTNAFGDVVEAVVAFTAGSAITKGNVVFVNESSANTFTVSCTSGGCGTATLVAGTGAFALATDGEALYAYSDSNNVATDGITTMHSVMFTGHTEPSVVNGGSILPAMDPSGDWPLAIIVDGFPAVQPDRVEFTPTTPARTNVSRVILENPSNYVHAQTNAALSTLFFTNLNLVSANPTLTVTASPSSVLENSGTGMVYTFTLSANAPSNMTVNFTVGGSAVFATDYTQTGAATFNATSGTITILSGSNTASMTLTPTGEASLEPHENIVITIGSGSGYDAGSPGAATTTINNDDTTDNDPLVAIIGVSHTDPDGFSFVATKDIPAGTVVYFTDNSFNNNTLSFGSGEAVLRWTSPGSTLARGSVVVVTETGVDTFTVTCSSGCGTIALLSGNFATATTGETLYAYSDTDANPSNGVTDVYSVLFTGTSVITGGTIPTIEDPSTVYLSALVVDGFPSTPAPARVEYDLTKRGVLVTEVTFEDISNWVFGQSPPALSTVPFANINVNDAVPPTAVCQNISVTPTPGTGSVTITASQIDNGSTDNVGIASITVSPDTFTCANIGTPVTVTLTVTDTSGNVATCTATVTVLPNTVPTFTQIGPFCNGDTFSLPTTSNNGIAGTWAPAINNAATTTYTFTPDLSLCGAPVTMTVVVNPVVVPTFTPVAPICSGGSLSALPTTSNNGISGTWSPALDNTATTTYTFTPSSGTCVTTATLTIAVNPLPVTPIVTSNSPLCEGDTVNLSVTNPVNYHMSPNSGVAFIDIDATGTQITGLADDSEHAITIPAFTFNGVTYTDALVSMNGVIVFGATGGQVTFTNATLPTVNVAAGNVFIAPYWDDLDIQTGAKVATQTVGNKFIIQYTTTTHNDSPIGSITFQVQMDLVTGEISYVYPDVVFGNASFDSGVSATVGMQFSTTSAMQYSFNTASLVNGQSITFSPVTYSWTGPNSFASSLPNPTIPNATAAATGGYNLVVTDVATNCSSAVATTSVVVNATVTPTFAQEGPICSGDPLSLPATSTNGVTGTWAPAIDNTATTTYTFTPDAGQCASTAVMTVTVNSTPAPTGSQNIIVTMVGGCSNLSGLYNYIGELNGKHNYVNTVNTTVKLGYSGTTWVLYELDNFNSNGYENNDVTASLFPPTTVWTPTQCGAGTFNYVFQSTQTFCSGATVADLQATGTSLQWYDVDTGGTALSASTPLVSGNYFVTQTLNGCESERTPVTVIVNPTVTPAFTPIAPICSGGTFTLPTTSNNGVTGTWAPAINNTATTTYTFTPDAGQCGLTVTMEVEVTPTPTVNAVANQTVCNGDATTTVAYTGTPSGQATVYTVSPFTNIVYTIPTSTYQATAQVNATLTGFTVLGINSISYDPSTSQYYVVVRVGTGSTPRRLGTINPVTGVITDLGSLGDRFSYITFSPTGNLWGVTGNGATCSECLYTINKATATTSFIQTLGVGADGEIILFNPADNFLYHWSGNGTVEFEKLNSVTYAATPIGTFSSGVGSGEVFGASIDPLTGDFIINDISSNVERWNATGPVSQIGITRDMGGSPIDVRGFVLGTSSQANTYNWTNDNPSIGLAASGSGDIPSFTATNATASPVTATITVTPSLNGCDGTPVTFTITVNPTITSTFTQIDPICSGATLTLPTTSDNGITGTWAPVADNTATTTYTFTPDAGQCATSATMTVVVNPLTSNTTTIAACDTYTWAVNGTTYTASGMYTSVTGCNTEILDLTITPSTSNTTIASACDTYTWAVNGTTYTSSGVYNVVTGCHTETLDLIIDQLSASINPYTPSCVGQLVTLSATTTLASGTNYVPFTGAFNVANWSFANAPSGVNGSVNTGAAPSSIAIVSGNSGAGGASNFSIVVPPNVTNISFDWSYTTTDGANWDRPQVINNGIPSLMTGYNSGGSNVQSGSMSVTVVPGQTFALSMITLDGIAGAATTVISNFTASGSSPITYAWTASSGGTIVGAANDDTVQVSTTGTYTLTTTNGTCTDTDSINVTFTTPSGDPSVFGNNVWNVYAWNAGGTNDTGSSWNTNYSGYYTTTTLGFDTQTQWCNTCSPSDAVGYQGCTVAVENHSWSAKRRGFPAAVYSIDIPSHDDEAELWVNGVMVWEDTGCCDSHTAVWQGNLGAFDTVEFRATEGVGGSHGIIAFNVLPFGPANLTATYCGATLNNTAVTLVSNYVQSAQMYRFRVRHGVTGAVIGIVDRPVNSFALSNMPGITLATTYVVDVTIRVNNVWQPFYGSPCTVTTPTPLATIGAQCGTTLSSMGTWIYATYQPSVTAYRFRITNTATSAVEIYNPVSGLNKFNFNQLPAAFRSAGTVYSVEVSLRNTDGTYLPYGAACNVTTPGAALPTKVEVYTEFKALAYPNPFAENFMFDVSTSSQNTIQIRVYDMLGKEVENRNVEVTDINNIQFGDRYPSGVYNVIVSQGENTKTLRVIKR